MNDEQDLTYDVSLAIVGMAGRFPGAKNLAEFWQNLVNGVKSVRFLSDEELLAAGVPSNLLRNPNYVKARPILDDVDLFDAPFFGFTPREAEVLDPQTRFFLECTWEALEDAGYNPEAIGSSVGVFAGKGFPTYLWNNLAPNSDIVETMGTWSLVIGNENDSLAPIVAYKLDLKGPGITVQTCCSTSLVTVHLACQSLLTYECDMALAGGVMIEVPHGTGYLYQEGGILSPDGECRAFDLNTQGTVFSSGVGVVVLKRMGDALRDGDHIYAVILGSAANNDGVMRAGYTAPGLNGQAAVIAAALGNAEVDAETIGYAALTQLAPGTLAGNGGRYTVTDAGATGSVTFESFRSPDVIRGWSDTGGAGDAFDEMAREVSDGPLAAQGGALPWLDSEGMAAQGREFYDTVLGLEVGEVSEPVLCPHNVLARPPASYFVGGLLIVRLDEIEESRQLGFDEAALILQH